MNNIEIVPYNPDWPKIFTIEASKIKGVLGDKCLNIHHIGSTSVPGLASKTKIDIIAEVKNLMFDHILLENIGYVYRGGFNIPLRKTFTYRSDDLNINLHIFEEDDPEIELNILFRDYLKANDTARNEYRKLKYKLLKTESSHLKKDGAMYRGYTLEKGDFIHDILRRTGFNRLRIIICTHQKEWEKVKYFRQKYFFGPYGVEDPYTWTFDHKEHTHLVLYEGVDIIGYAHVQFWNGKRAAIRIIVIDEEKRNKNIGSEFLSLIEKWLRMQDVKSIHAESRQSSLNFYLKNGYLKIPFNDPELHESDQEDIAVGKIL